MTPAERADQRATEVGVASHRLMLIVLALVDWPLWGYLLLLVAVLAAQFASFRIIHSQEFGDRP